jgi:4-amino-4-deoxy-L-arabinose transferase-like glycosyltransferase
MKEKIYSYLAALLLFLIPLQALTSIRYKSASVEEGIHVAAGVHYWHSRDVSAFPGYPPVGRMLLGAWPALSGANPRIGPEIHKEMYPFPAASRFLYQQNDADRVLFKARATVTLISTLLGFYIWRFATSATGPISGLTALFIYTFCPNMLAHGRLATLDLMLSAFFFMALYHYRLAVTKGGAWNRVLACVFTSLAVDTKYSALLIFPVVLMWHVGIYLMPKQKTDKERKKKHTAVHVRAIQTSFWPILGLLMITLFFINLQYGFKGSFKSLRSSSAWSSLEKGEPMSTLLKELHRMPIVSQIPLPLPSQYILGLDFTVFADQDEMHPNWYFGKLYTNGERFWGYYPAILAFKMPIPLLIGMIAWLFWGGIKFIKSPETTEQFLFLLIPFLCFLFFYSFICQSQLGLRLILPILPFAFCGISLVTVSLFKTAPAPHRLRPGVVAVCTVLTGWFLFSSIYIFPNYLSYFNELAGGPTKGSAYFADANLDWGQDLKGLKKYMDERGIEKIHLVYYGPNGQPELDYYGIQPLAPNAFPDAPWAISATWRYYAHLEPFKSEVPFDFKKREPDHWVGYSIMLFDGPSVPGHSKTQ